MRKRAEKSPDCEWPQSRVQLLQHKEVMFKMELELLDDVQNAQEKVGFALQKRRKDPDILLRNEGFYLDYVHYGVGGGS